MVRVYSSRIVQRIVILITTFCLFGSISVWFHLFTEFDSVALAEVDPYGAGRIARDDVPSEPSRIERLDWEIHLRTLKRNLVKENDLEHDLRASSVIVRNVFGIKPIVVLSKHYPRSINGGKKDNGIISIGVDSKERSRGDKYLFVFHHYEQLGKTTENFIQLSSIAAYGSRMLVEPFVRDSRMCGLETGWWGTSLTKSRLFRPLSVYFDVNMMNELLSQNGYSTVQPLADFRNVCNISMTNLTLVHFLYGDGKETTKKWFNMSEEQYRQIYLQSKSHGWTDCPVIDKGLNISQRLGGMRTGRQLCVNAEKMKDHKAFEDKILKRDKCVVIVYWKGFGINRTHFKPKVKLTAREIVHKIRHSSTVVQEAELFRRVFLDKRYIAVHVRSERQILWYSLNAFLKCVNLVIKVVSKLKQKYKVDSVFLASDLTQFGSDTLVPGNLASMQLFEKHLSEGLKPKKYSPHEKDAMLRDHGVVAIVEMNILSHSDHLVTLGSGSFQEWVMALFTENKKDSKEDWTITRVCSKEKKVH